MDKSLRLKYLAIGSLPHKDVKTAMELVRQNFDKIPFFPQLANYNRNEDMMVQFLEGFPSYKSEKDFCVDCDSEEFCYALEEFFSDYEEIIPDINSPKLEKYSISKNASSTFSEFEKIISETKPEFAKGQITGAFTLAGVLTDNNSASLVFDETLRDIVVKHLTLKALWEIKHIKTANSETTPIIFMDEPSISQVGTSAYLTINEDEIVNMISKISEVIKSAGGISAIHCCGKCDWRIPINAGVDIINFDAYSFMDNFLAYGKEISLFLNDGGKIAWGLVPTLSADILKDLTINELVQKFEYGVKNLTKFGIDEKLIIENSLITSSCGAGGLPVEYANKAMTMIKELAQELEKRF